MRWIPPRRPGTVQRVGPTGQGPEPAIHERLAETDHLAGGSQGRPGATRKLPEYEPSDSVVSDVEAP
jgi:hypothetical protein